MLCSDLPRQIYPRNSCNCTALCLYGIPFNTHCTVDEVTFGIPFCSKQPPQTWQLCYPPLPSHVALTLARPRRIPLALSLALATSHPPFTHRRPSTAPRPRSPSPHRPRLPPRPPRALRGLHQSPLLAPQTRKMRQVRCRFLEPQPLLHPPRQQPHSPLSTPSQHGESAADAAGHVYERRGECMSSSGVF